MLDILHKCILLHMCVLSAIDTVRKKLQGYQEYYIILQQ